MLCLAFASVIWISMAEGLLLKPQSKCVPTAAVRGPCHECVCSTQGVYHCWHKKCDNNETETTDFDQECEPFITYIAKGTICSCNAIGDWRSTNCRNLFRRIQIKNTLAKQTLRTNIPCTPYLLYLIDCNICRCEPNGVFKVSSCTSRPCSAVHKTQTCKPGEIERFGNELCSCSDINYFIDKLCFPINEKDIQPVEDKNVEKLVYADQPWRRNFIDNYRCNQNITFTMDCNTCVCKKGSLECTTNVCDPGKNIGRSKKSAQILPELKSADQRCQPGKKYRFRCNICVCADDGLPTCTRMVCLNNYVLDLPSLRAALKTTAETPNLTTITRTLPDIHGVEKCTPGQTYKIDCNTCFCKKDGNFMCTKVLCLPPKDGRKQNIDEPQPAREAVSENEKEETTQVKTLKQKLEKIPPIPKEACVPGKIYRKGCQFCFCDDTKKVVCTNKKKACKQFVKGRGINHLEIVHPPYKPKDVEELPELPQRQVKCQPGKSYKVDCNSCVCLSSFNLLCDEFICLSYDDMHRIEAEEKSKGLCTTRSYNKTVENCVVCDCVDGKVKCNEEEGCITEKDKKLPNWNNGHPKLTLDMFKETCIPGGVYRMDCNNCYCQEDSTLRCTQKTCLNYSQSKALEKQRIFLLTHGL